jgi:hypothetical protein
VSRVECSVDEELRFRSSVTVVLLPEGRGSRRQVCGPARPFRRREQRDWVLQGVA